MTVYDIVKRINQYLAGEQLVYSALEPFLDEVIDDINSSMNTTFPSFSDTVVDNNITGTEYTAIPDSYIRSVVIKGAAAKFYIMDEEGSPTAEQYDMEYRQAKFFMLRDYAGDVPEEYESDSKGSVVYNDEVGTPFTFEVW